MKKSLLPVLLASSLLAGLAGPGFSYGQPVFAEESGQESQEEHGHDHETEEDHDHDHEGHDHDHEDHDHDHEGHDHDHAVEFDPEMVVKKDGDNYIMAHGDHFHTIPASDLSQEQVEAADKYLEEHPEVTENYDKQKDVQAGFFEDNQVKDRELTDWAGDWQSVYPYLEDGTLDPVMDKKAEAEDADMTAEEYKEYYETGYKTDVDHININEDSITFVKGDTKSTAKYEYAGYKILEYDGGNRGVRYLFTKVEGDEEAPTSVQFSDHNIEPSEEVDHFHIFFSNDDQDTLLEEMDNWPTYFPSDWTGDQIFTDLMNH